MKHSWTAAVAAGLGLALQGVPAKAQEAIGITIISGNSPQTSSVYGVVNGFIPTVDTELAKSGKYKITWNEAYSGQIAKPRAELEAVASGLGDVGLVITAYTPDKLPLHQIGFSTPFSSQNVEVQIGALNVLLDTEDAFKAEWGAFNQHALRISGIVDAYSFHSTVPMKTLEDIKGKKLAGVGANLPWIVAAGGAPVTGEMSTAYNSLQSGVYEGVLFWQQIAMALKLCEPAPYALITGAGGSPTVALTVNSDVWGGLPDEVKAAFKVGAEEWHKANIKALLEGSAAGRKVCEDEYGQETATLSEEEMRAWASELPALGKEWAERADARGGPGAKMLSTYMAYMRDNGQTVMRDWDRE
ncbi:hypothetical protein [Agrobacterium tumefaciens]|uniref:C4-dicarboxylate ABC transporter substrate-binding protein n=1 Tax=Agrobacterium tumefaciens TaxID=358 RepID=A0A2L2LM52_AGRTU|nr:hypothetical protein [Agrobacterium tumefaciens]AVH45411.1 hypothetical protein At1D1609_53790 [Agrobacterium tumefaciens]NSY99140.1 hypothetical protein [Agrobacterium tumefaciens]